jgi:hypothetical protein
LRRCELTLCCLEGEHAGAHESVEASGKDDLVPRYWRYSIRECIMSPSSVKDRKVRRQALQYTVVGDELYKRTMDGVLLMCLGEKRAKVAMGEVHEGMCGTHQLAHKMRWMLKRVGFYWPSMISDCFKYYKVCEACQRFGDIQIAPASMLHPIVKPWLFRGWGLDFVGEIHPSSSKGHHFVLVATDYFSKWTEAVPLKNMTHREIIQFMTEHIIHWSGLPQTLTTDQGLPFISHEFKEFAASLKIKLLNSCNTVIFIGK